MRNEKAVIMADEILELLKAVDKPEHIPFDPPRYVKRLMKDQCYRFAAEHVELNHFYFIAAARWGCLSQVVEYLLEKGKLADAYKPTLPIS